MITFLIIALIAGFILIAVIEGTSKRGRGSRRGWGGHSSQRSGSSNYRPTPARLDREQIVTRWATIQAMAAGGGNGLRQAVSEADKLLDHVMRQSGASGDTMGERLKSFQGRFSDTNSVWRAHKLRNALAHEVGYDLVPSQAKEALRDFERALRDLGGL